MASVHWSLKDIPPERHEQRAAQRDTDSLKDLEVEVRCASFDPALDHPADPRSSRKLRPGPPAALAHSVDLDTDPSPLFLVASSRVDRELRTSDPGHDRHMFIPTASPVLTCGRRALRR
jgi:hypothetical protein